jgi:hypothetical protein
VRAAPRVSSPVLLGGPRSLLLSQPRARPIHRLSLSACSWRRSAATWSNSRDSLMLAWSLRPSMRSCRRGMHWWWCMHWWWGGSVRREATNCWWHASQAPLPWHAPHAPFCPPVPCCRLPPPPTPRSFTHPTLSSVSRWASLRRRRSLRSSSRAFQSASSRSLSASRSAAVAAPVLASSSAASACSRAASASASCCLRLGGCEGVETGRTQQQASAV